MAIGVPFTITPIPSIMEAWGHIRYCPPPLLPDAVGFVVTKVNCNGSTAGSGGAGGNGEPLPNDPNNPGTPVEIPMPKYYYTGITPQVNITLTSGPVTGTVPAIYGINSGMSPLIWGRLEEPPTIVNGTPVGSTSYRTRFIVQPDGRAGFNTANPRGTVDVMHTGSQTTATAIFGSPSSQVLSATNPLNPYGIAMRYSKHLAVFNNLPIGKYNGIVQEGDQALIFTDGKGTDGANMDGALVIGPWRADNSFAGLRMDKDGNASLRGTFEVQGKIQCNGFLSKPKWWPDFVFENDFQLMNLDSLGNYIKQNKHLPGIPSRTVILSEGQNIGEIQLVQQQKIEELFLYIMQQNQELEKLKIALKLIEAENLNKK